MRWGNTLVLCAVLAVAGCHRPRATEGDCEHALDRIVALELHERGFADAALVARKQEELRRSLAGELKQCIGKRLKPNAMRCIDEATSSEQISHRCLH